MDPNAIALLNMATQALTQAMQYQMTVARAQAEDRKVSDEEIIAARVETTRLLEFLKSMP